jgi:hypothetical protein
MENGLRFGLPGASEEPRRGLVGKAKEICWELNKAA